MTQAIGGQEAVIRIVENEDDLKDFFCWMDHHRGANFACDTETTGLDIFSPDFRVRTVQIGVGLEAWVLPVEEMQPYQIDRIWIYVHGEQLTFHNASYDVLAIRQYFGVQLDWERITDTKILAHLVDSRSKQEGGTGHSLQELTAAYLDPEVAESVKGSMMQMANEIKVKKGEVFKSIDLWNETYLLYAGMDVILTFGLRNMLLPRVPSSARGLIGTEHRLARVCSEIEANGFLVDVDYAQRYSEQLREEQDVWEAVALAGYGTESVNANAQVAEDLIQDGVRLTELTDSGNYKLDKTILEPLAEDGHPLATAVTEAKKAKKWRTSWVDKFLDMRDGDNRCHANINPLLARTARMSITGIPAQTLPSSDWTVRRCFVADPGETIVSCDYQAQELRVLAALSGDRNMIQAFQRGDDLHQITADASGVDRSVGKTTNFAYVYGSGAGNIAATTGISVKKAKEVIEGFESTFPGVKRLSNKLSAEAKRNGFIETGSGRRLYVDQDRSYAALNYMIQSTSRDITAAALLRLDALGFTPYLRLPIHDEILASVPSDKAEWGAETIAQTMTTDFGGLTIAADADVFGPDWGAGYVGDDDREAYEATYQ